MNDDEQPNLETDEMAYREQKDVAHDGDLNKRRELAGGADTRPEILYYLASDPDTEIRKNIARNHQAPRHADILLAQDHDPEVRADVATKIADISAAVSAGTHDNTYRLTMEALEILARDQLLRVREVLSETLKDCPTVPVDIIERLAGDKEITVARPVLEHSPLLSDEFLLSLVARDPIQGALGAIARRVALGESVADAIVHNGDSEAIAELLGNDSAQIREETLDRIVDQASGEPTWHQPLVHRPNLHVEAAMRIAEIVTAPLLEELTKRADLDDSTVSAIKEVVLRRLDSGDLGTSAKPAPSTKQAPEQPQGAPTGSTDMPAEEPSDSAVTKRVRQLYLNNELNEQAISSALASGGQEFVIYAMALKSKTPLDVVSRAISMRNIKAIVALCWQAGLSMRLATRIQMNLANIPPSDVLRATASDEYPLSQDEMTWQLEFISGLAGAC